MKNVEGLGGVWVYDLYFFLILYILYILIETRARGPVLSVLAGVESGCLACVDIGSMLLFGIAPGRTLGEGPGVFPSNLVEECVVSRWWTIPGPQRAGRG